MRKVKKSDKTNKILLYILLFLVFVNLAVYGLYRYFNPIALKSETYVLQVNDEFDPTDNLKYVFLGDTADVKVSGDDTLDINTVGDYIVTYTYKGKAYPYTVSIVDQYAPVLEVKDYETDLLEDVTESDFLVSCIDDSRYTVKMESEQSTGTAGNFNVSVTATDQYGNSTTKNVTLTRTEDTEAPVIEDFQEEVEIGVGEEFSTNQYTVTDNLDSSPYLYVDTTGLDIWTPGTYTLTYTVTDRSGNQQTYDQKVNVVERRVAYLTFDDGPSEESTPKILDILDQYGIKATFFVTAQDPDAYPYMKQAAEAGHTIAIHSYSHDYATVYSSPEAYFQDLETMKGIIKDVTGIDADVIRFPGGSSNTVSANYTAGIMSYLTNAVEEAGYEYFDWNVSSGDAAAATVDAQTIINNVVGEIGTPYAVMLFHDTDAKTTTVEALPAIIEAYQAAGYEFEPLTKDSYTAHHGVNN